MSMASIPFLDLAPIHRELDPLFNAALSRVLGSGIYILGPELEVFENEFADYCETSHCVGVGNGLDALRLGLLALGVQPGDEVIVPSHTFIATWLAVTACGAIPVPVEPGKSGFTLSPDGVGRAISNRTRVILPVHLYGQPADLDPILALARSHGIKVLEDAAQAHGTRYKGKRVGGHGDAVAWSFYPGKNLGALGDGGAVTTADPTIAEHLRMLRNYGSTRKYHHEIEGINSRLDSVQAAWLRTKLPHLDRWNAMRCEIAAIYIERLGSHAGELLKLPLTPAWADPVWHLFVVECEQRDRVQARLAEANISTLIHYPTPPHLQPAYAGRGWRPGDFPIAERLAGKVLSLPIYPGMSTQAARQVADTLLRILDEI